MTDEFNQIAEGEGLDDFLISLAEGVASAQAELNQLVINSPSGSGVSYQIPKLEFELKLQVNTQQSSSMVQANESELMTKKKPYLRVASPTTTQQSSAASVIKGVLMAVPTNSGKPGFSLNLNMGVILNGEVPIMVEVVSAVGEAQVNVPVEINVDRQRSALMSQQEGRSGNVSPNTYIKNGLVMTGADGKASTVLVVDQAELQQTPIVVTVDALSETESLIYRVQ